VDPGATPRSAPVRVLFVGTSLTAGYGLDDVADAWPNQLGRIADSLGYRIAVQNAGLSGETSAGALRRMDWLLRDSADVVVVETGANDGLRGQSVPELRANLGAIIAKIRAAQPAAEVVVVQMEAPPNLGPSYAGAFRTVFPEVAKATGATLAPFLLDSVAGIASLNQADGIHPTAAGARKAARNLWPTLRAVLEKIGPRTPRV
jgi:acyl-CoA thioesterase I